MPYGDTGMALYYVPQLCQTSHSSPTYYVGLKMSFIWMFLLLSAGVPDTLGIQGDFFSV